MKVLLINGSPNPDGCTKLALDEVAKILTENNIKTELMWIGNNISGCIGCNKCLKDNQCFKDDIVNHVISKMKNVDGIVLGSPVHFSGISGNMKSLLDRLFYGRKNLFQGKVCANVVSARRAGAMTSLDELNKYPLISNMYLVGSSYWNQIYGTTKEEAKKDLEGLQTMRNLGRNMAYILKSIENSNIEKPIYELNNKTNFIKKETE